MPGRLNQTSVATFTDDPAGALHYQLDFEPAFDDAYLRNHIEVNAADGTRGRTGSGIAIDTASADEHGTIVHSIDSKLTSGGERQGLAEYHAKRYAQPELRLPALNLNAAGNTGAWATILDLDISDAITVVRFDTDPDEMRLEVNVEGVRHRCKVGGPWTIQVATSPRDTRTYFQVGHATRGKVGTAAGNKIPGVGQLP